MSTDVGDSMKKFLSSDFQLPGRGSISGRSSSITAAFYQAITPVIAPTTEQVNEVLDILGMSPGACVCAYCGGRKTEWDHFRPTVIDRKPTGFITEIYNLVPACGKCNQSKGNKDWLLWMRSDAKLAPKNTAPEGFEDRVRALEQYERWSDRYRTCLNFEEIAGAEVWSNYRQLLEDANRHLQTAQEEATRLRSMAEKALLATRGS